MLYGKDEEFLLNQVWDQLGKEPEPLQNKPEVFPDLVDVVQAFFTLSRSRQIGNVPSPILVSEMLAYAQVFGVDDLEMFVTYIQTADDVYLSNFMDRMKTENGKA